MSFCDYLQNNTCRLIENKCGWLSDNKPCRLYFVYPKIKPQETDPLFTLKVKKKLCKKAIVNWRDYNKKKMEKKPRGGRSMFGKPLEDNVMNLLKNELNGATVEVRKRIEILNNLYVIIDGKIEKEGKPTSLISCKVTLDPLSFRESFSCAFFAKKHYDNVKFYMIATHPSSKLSKQLIDISKHHMDGVYYLSEKPYFDELVKELEGIYMGSNV